MKRRSLFLSSVLLAAMFIFSASALADAGALKDWNGDWNSTYSHLDAPEYNAVYEAIQKHLPLYTAKGVKGAFQKMYHTDFLKMKVDAESITFIGSEGKDLGKVAYEARPRPEGDEWKDWFLFEAVPNEEADKSAKVSFVPGRDARFLIALAPHAHDDGPVHWHLRYGKKSFDELIAQKDWWGTGIDPQKSAADLVKGIDPEAYSKYLARPLNEWKGDWISSLKLIKNPLMDPVFESIAAEAKKLGKNYTAAEVRAFYEKNYGTTWDNLTVTDEEFIFKKEDGSVIVTCKILNDGLIDGWYALKADQPGFKNIVAGPVHGDGANLHWHFRYSDEKTPEELRVCKDGTPTCFNPKITTPEAYAENWGNSVAKRAERLPDKK